MRTKKLLMTIALSLILTGAYAQKIDQRLTLLVEQPNQRRAQGKSVLDTAEIKKNINVTFHPDGMVERITVIATLKPGATVPTKQLEQLGIKVRFVVSDKVVLIVPAESLKQLEQVEELAEVSVDEAMEPDNDLARKETKVSDVSDLVKAQAAGLPKAYTGNGVILGIIDQGIDFNHASFRMQNGATRIKRVGIWNKLDYQEYSTEEEISSLTTDNTVTSHGSHTAATAGGSETGKADTQTQGMAPDTELFLIGLANSPYHSNIAESIRKIFAYAEKENKPAVISISMGNIAGLHDGSNLVPKAVAESTEKGTKPGRAVLISASNEGNKHSSISKMLNDGEELKTVIGVNKLPSKRHPNDPVSYNCFIFCYADDYKDFDLQLKAVNITTGEISEVGTHLLNRSNYIYTANLTKRTVPVTVRGGSCVTYSLEIRNIHMDDNNYRLALVAKAGSNGQTIRLINRVKGLAEPPFDAPTDKGYDFAANGFTKGNSKFAFNCSICDDAVISVGSYITRNQWVTYQGEGYTIGKSVLTGQIQQVGEISDFSSYSTGDDNGKCHPTLIAPGHRIVSAANNYDTHNFLRNYPGTLNAQKRNGSLAIADASMFDRDNWYIQMQGTSMATPVAAGIVALWMQADPTLTVNRIKAVMRETCVNDQWTTDVTKIPSGRKEQAGYGKINCLEGLKKILNTSAIETISLDGHRQATPATMYSVDAPVYNMMGQRVDKSHPGLVIYKGRKYVNR